MSNSSQPLVSIIVPCYNHGQYLAECLESVLKQSYPAWECIVVDNGSTDNSAAVAKHFCEKDKRFRYYAVPQKGVSFARNYGIGQSRGTYILPLDSDDRLGAAYIEKGVAAFEKDPSLKVVYCQAKLFGAVDRDYVLPEFSIKELLIENLIFCSALFKKADFENTKGYNEAMAEGFEDWDFWIGFLKNGGNVYCIPETLFYYRIKTSSRNSDLDVEKQKRLRRQIFENHREAYERLLPEPELAFEFYELRNKYKSLKQSRSYKLGRLLLSPFSFLRK
ncbi:MAG: glycosyltransferase family 2 protein [Bacteroidia bacterium]